ncbi:hypothetical protein MPLSOD_120250 [Mesorhizobium sp. SOD10]|nr:hypothetical protein MPLSOD_120250 [Mesorhizobium sp. SOD10]
MRTKTSIRVVGCHAEGEIGDVIVGGVLPPAGRTMMEKMITMERDHDHIRRMLICEPRGSVARHVNLLVPSTREDCAAGAIIMEPTEYPRMFYAITPRRLASQSLPTRRASWPWPARRSAARRASSSMSCIRNSTTCAVCPSSSLRCPSRDRARSRATPASSRPDARTAARRGPAPRPAWRCCRRGAR